MLLAGPISHNSIHVLIITADSEFWSTPYKKISGSICSKSWLAEIFNMKCASGFSTKLDFSNLEMFVRYLFTIVLWAFALWPMYRLPQRIITGNGVINEVIKSLYGDRYSHWKHPNYEHETRPEIQFSLKRMWCMFYIKKVFFEEIWNLCFWLQNQLFRPESPVDKISGQSSLRWSKSFIDQHHVSSYAL